MTPAPGPPGLRLDEQVTLQKFEVLCVAVDAQSLTRAAERLGTSEPIVTSQLRSLERQLGIELFERSRGHRAFALSEEGQQVHRWASETLASGRAMMRDLTSAGDSGVDSVVLGASISVGSYLLPPVIARFHRECPDAQFTLLVGDSAEELQLVEEGHSDLCIVILASLPRSGVLVGELVGRDELVLVTAGEADVAELEIDAADVAQLPIVAAPVGTARRKLLDDLLTAQGAAIENVRLEVGHPEAAKRSVLESAGATFISRAAVADELKAGRLREMRVRGVDVAFAIYAVRRRDRQGSRSQSVLLEMITESLAATLVTEAEEDGQ